MLSITSHQVAFDDGYLELSVDIEYAVEDKEVTGLELYATVLGKDGNVFATPVETALLDPNDNEMSLWKSFLCSETFVGESITIHYRAFFVEDGGVVDLGVPKNNGVELMTDLTGAKWKAGFVSTVGTKLDGNSADLIITLGCEDPQEWAWMVTPLSGDARGHSNFEPFGGKNYFTFEANTYELENGIQLDVNFLRAGPRCTISTDL